MIGNPIGWLYVILVVALLTIVSNNSSTIKNLKADLDAVNAELISVGILYQESQEAFAEEIKLREEAYTELDTLLVETQIKIQSLETMVGMKNQVLEYAAEELKSLNAKLNDSDAERGLLEVEITTLENDVTALEIEVTTLEKKLNDTNELLDWIKENQ